MTKTVDVAAGQKIASVYGNELRDRTLQVFATVAERDAQYATAPNGAICVTLDTNTMWKRAGGVWVSAVLGPVAAVSVATFQSVAAGATVDVTGLTVTVNALTARRYRTDFGVRMGCSAADAKLVMTLENTGGGVYKSIAGRSYGTGTNLGLGINMAGSAFHMVGGTFPLAAGSNTLKVRVNMPSAGGIANTEDPGYLVVTDLGPEP
jgi:hypothetical protein